MQTCYCAVCLHAVWVAKTGKVWVKSPTGDPTVVPGHLTPNYLNILEVKTAISALFFLLLLNHDIILSSSLTLIEIYIHRSLRTPFSSKSWYSLGLLGVKHVPTTPTLAAVPPQEIWTRQAVNVTQLFWPKMGWRQFFHRCLVIIRYIKKKKQS